jgi:hypothetical protein
VSDIVHLVRPELHVALDCPADWTVMEMDDQAGLRMSDPDGPRVALQVSCSNSDSPLDETSESLRNGLLEDARPEQGTLRRRELEADGRANPDSPPVNALVFSALDSSFVYRVLVAEDAGHHWTVRLETLHRKEWWQQSKTLETMLSSLLLL